MKMSLSYKLVIGCSLILLISLSITFYVINERQQQLIIRQAENEARAVFQQIVIMRRWISDHGGVFVEQLPWAQEGPPIQAQSARSEARRYSHKTPAMVTKELVSYARDKGLYWFHITSLKLTNPENAPDDFERAALLRFEEEPLQEIIAMEKLDKTSYLRYISPLYVEETCLACHEGYQIGGVRGAISVTLPLGKIFAEAKTNRNLMFGSMLLLVIILGSTLLYFLRRMVLVPVDELTTSIRHFSEKGPPPGAIVRSGDEFEELSRSFEEMAASLSEYQSELEDKVRDATLELQQLNQQIRDASERKSEFLARAAHELRTPLTSIRGAVEYITARMKQPSPAAKPSDSGDLIEFFEIVQKNTDRLIRMVQTMLDIEYIEAGAEQTLNLSSINLTKVIQESVQSFKYDAERYCLDLCSLPTDLPQVHADEDRLRQVLTNLLGNAVKFAHEHTAITVFAEHQGDLVQVKICNVGPTIPADKRENVFGRFYRSGEKAGTGLGLAICRAIVEAHGGTIHISDPDQGSGVCVYFTLPIHHDCEEIKP